jgi:hypothetical protein
MMMFGLESSVSFQLFSLMTRTAGCFSSASFSLAQFSKASAVRSPW